ncbi:helix-turn-helix domain-containing protein [Aliagarivorans taiwanensis]|uniref:helix-turn-helix domain-containing protein n=1 Tax=Aliagarivorans taiwanensis TaxID=561966 RepID=UPI00047870B2|nr:helix-turn-helix transcriptional regulator [Aliagarivorans taiwanensis]
MDKASMNVGNVLKERRISLNMKQEDLAERMGVVVQTVSKWERGITEPKASQVAMLSEILDITEREICRGQFSSGKLETTEFVRKVSNLMNAISETEMLFVMQSFIDDEEGFIQKLSSAVASPSSPDPIVVKLLLSKIESGEVTFSSEVEKQSTIAALTQAVGDN